MPIPGASYGLRSKWRRRRYILVEICFRSTSAYSSTLPLDGNANHRILYFLPAINFITIVNRFEKHSDIIYDARFRNGKNCAKKLLCRYPSNTKPHSIVTLREYFKNIPLKSCNIARIFIKFIERFLKYCRNLAMSA